MAYMLMPAVENLFAAAAVLCAFSLKIFAVCGFARAVNRYFRDPLASWLATWIALQALMVCAMLVVSMWSGLTTMFAWTWLVSVAGLSIVARTKASSDDAPKQSRLDAPSWAFLILLALMALRSFLMFDYTLDGFAYGYTRMAIWMNYGTLLLHMDTVQINIFSNEWNGELNGLLYGLSAGNIQGFGFGNIEIMAILFLSTRWLARLLSGKSLPSSAIALVIASSPAVLGLTTTTKGDLLATACIILATGFTLKAIKTERPYPYIAMAIASAGLSIGSKLASAPFCLVILVALSLTLAKPLRLKSTIVAICGGTAFAGIFCSRFIVNLFVFGDPLTRASGESTEFSLATFLGNLGLLFRRLLSGAERAPFDVWALSAGFGTATLFTAIVVALNFQDIRKRRASPNLVILVLSLAALVVCAALIPYRPWSFRYMLPAVSLLAIALATLSTARRTRFMAAVSILGALFNIGSASRPGEIIPPPAAIPLQRHLTNFGEFRSIERAMMFHPGTYQAYHVRDLCLDEPGGKGKEIVTLNSINTFYFPFLGSSAQNRIHLTNSLDEMVAMTAQVAPDVVSITRGRLEKDGDEVLKPLGYVRYAGHDFGDVKTALFVNEKTKKICS